MSELHGSENAASRRSEGVTKSAGMPHRTRNTERHSAEPAPAAPSGVARQGTRSTLVGSRVRLRDDQTSSTFTTMKEVKNRRRGATRISSKHQITIPADALRAAGLEVGDRVVAHADGAGRVVLEREHDILAEFAGAMTGAYTVNELDSLRREWD
jgi:bifunctional DNA-binding transcriptional regulator/antitoxin component of YhaV-PrlF toxin-antitoxin module